jgi:hypothetical protein
MIRIQLNKLSILLRYLYIQFANFQIAYTKTGSTFRDVESNHYATTEGKVAPFGQLLIFITD